MAEILRKQYESTFSQPDPDFNIDNLGEFFFSCGDKEQDTQRDKEHEKEQEQEMEQEQEKEQECTQEKERDQHSSDSIDGRTHACAVEELDIPTVSPTQPSLKDVHFNYTDIAHAIYQLSLCSGPGPYGISAILLKKSKLTISLMLN